MAELLQELPTAQEQRGKEKGCRITYFITRKTSALSSGRSELLNGRRAAAALNAESDKTFRWRHF